MTLTHELKILKPFADAKLSGDKLFEIRQNEGRGFQKGDIVSYFVCDITGKYFEEDHPLNKKTFEITYVLHFNGIEPGYVVFGEREITKRNDKTPS